MSVSITKINKYHFSKFSVIVRALAKVFKEWMLSAEKRDIKWKYAEKKKSQTLQTYYRQRICQFPEEKKEHRKDTVFRSSKGNKFFMS